MKKSIVYIVLSIFVLIISTSCTKNVEGYEPFNDEIDIYILYDKFGDDFFRNPSINKINSIKDDNLTTKFIKGSNGYSAQDKQERIVLGIYLQRISFLNDIETLDFLNDKGKVYEYLKTNGITDNIKYISVVSASNYPPVIWICCDKDNYFIVENNSNYDKFCFYAAQEYYNEFSPKRAQLFVNGKEVKSNIIKMGSNYSYLPFVETLKALGAKVEWRKNGKIADVMIRYEKFVFDCENMYFNKYGFENDYFHSMAGGNQIVFRYDESRHEVIVNNYYMEKIADEIFAANLTVDKDSRTIYITSKFDNNVEK